MNNIIRRYIVCHGFTLFEWKKKSKSMQPSMNRRTNWVGDATHLFEFWSGFCQRLSFKSSPVSSHGLCQTLTDVVSHYNIRFCVHLDRFCIANCPEMYIMFLLCEWPFYVSTRPAARRHVRVVRYFLRQSFFGMIHFHFWQWKRNARRCRGVCWWMAAFVYVSTTYFPFFFFCFYFFHFCTLYIFIFESYTIAVVYVLKCTYIDHEMRMNRQKQRVMI